MNKEILFSIVIVNYNHGKFLQEAIDSIHSQSFKNFELIIIDANSTDDSVEIIKMNESKIYYWISEPDSGQSEAFNKGFKKARGQFLFWLNADDILLPNSLGRAAASIDKNREVQWFAANTVFFDVNGLITKCTNGSDWSDFLFNKAPITVYGPTSIFSKKIFDEVGGFDESFHYVMDTDLWYRFKNAGYKFKRIHNYFWGFRIHKDSKTSHAYTEKKSDKFEQESNLLIKKNKIVNNKWVIMFQFIQKIINGNYFKSFLDTQKFTGLNISNFIK